MIFSRYFRRAIPLADYSARMRGEETRSETLKSGAQSFAAKLLARWHGGEREPLHQFLDAFASATHGWTIHNCAMVLSQKPELTVPVTPRMLRYLSHTNKVDLRPREGVKPASIFILVEPADETAAPGAKPAAAQHRFMLLPCVYDLRTEIVNGEKVELPERSLDFSSRIGVALADAEGVERLPKSWPSAAERAVSRHLGELHDGPFRKDVAALATYILLRALRESPPVPVEAIGRCAGQKDLFLMLAPAVKAVRAVMDPLIKQCGLLVSRYAAATARVPRPAIQDGLPAPHAGALDSFEEVAGLDDFSLEAGGILHLPASTLHPGPVPLLEDDDSALEDEDAEHDEEAALGF